MSDQHNKPFRAVALERAASLEQLDHLISITRPMDWILAVVIFLTLATAVAWSIFGRLPNLISQLVSVVLGHGRRRPVYSTDCTF